MRARFPAFNIIILSFIFIVAGVCPAQEEVPAVVAQDAPPVTEEYQPQEITSPPVISLQPSLGEKQVIDVLDPQEHGYPRCAQTDLAKKAG